MKVCDVRRSFGMFLTFFIFAIHAAFAQTEGVKEIKLDVTVMDKEGRLISGLKAGNFKVSDDGEIKALSSLSAVNEPVSIGIIIDVSKSIHPASVALVSQELNRFISAANPLNEYFAITFSKSIQMLVPFTKDPARISSVLKQINRIEPGNETKLFDAVKSGLETIEGASYRKRVLLVFGDASDNSSKVKVDHLRWLIRESKVLLYSLVDSSKPEVFPDQGIRIEELAVKSGGSAYFYLSEELNDCLTRIGLALKNQYLVGFAPSKSKSKNKDQWRKIKIIVESSMPGLRVSGSEGYYATNR
jgi:Ca-activated chloride channel homolog